MKDFVTDIFFDLDHTLWDFEKNSELTFREIFSKNNITIELHEFLEIYVPVNSRYWKLYREEKVNKEQLRLGRLKESFKVLDFKIEDELISVLSEEYIQNLTNYNYLFEDTITILDYLKPKYKLHIITNGFKGSQIEKLEKSNILSYFTHIINSESTGAKKPDPRIFHHALRMAKVAAHKAVMIGDNYEADIAGARNVGMNTIHFNMHNESVVKEEIQINNLIEIKQYL